MANGTDTIQPPITTPAHKELYDGLKNKGLYTKSYEDFTTQFAGPNARKQLYEGIKNKGLYKKGQESFDNQFFNWVPDPSIPAKKKEPTPSPSSAGVLPSPETPTPPEQPSEVDPGVLGTVKTVPLIPGIPKQLNPLVLNAARVLYYDIPAGVKGTGAASLGGITNLADWFRNRARGPQNIEGYDKVAEEFINKDLDDPLVQQQIKARILQEEGEVIPARTERAKEFKEVQKDLTNWAIEHSEKGQLMTQGYINRLEDIDSIEGGIEWLLGTVGESVAQIVPAAVTMGASVLPQEIGSIYYDGVQRIAEERGMTVDQVIDRGYDEPAAAMAYGIAASSLETVGATKVLGKWGKKQFKNWLLEAGRKGTFSAGSESVTEGMQTILEIAGTKGITVAEVMRRIAAGEEERSEFINAMAKGAVGGGTISSVSSLINPEATQKIAEQAQSTYAEQQAQPVTEEGPATPTTLVEEEAAAAAAAQETPEQIAARIRERQQEAAPDVAPTDQPTKKVAEEEDTEAAGKKPDVKPEDKPVVDTSKGKKVADVVRGRNTYTVEKDEGGLLTVKTKDGKAPSKPTVRAVIKQYAEETNFDTGQRLDPETVPTDLSMPQLNEHIRENSNNPAEIAETVVWSLSEDPTAIETSHGKTRAIAEGLGFGRKGGEKKQRGIRRTSWLEWGDRNWLNNSLARTYLKSGEGSIPLDQLAQEINEANPGMNVTEQDIVNFTVEFPSGAQAALKETFRSDIENLNEKFIEQTGLSLDQPLERDKFGRATRTVLDAVLTDQEAKLDKAVNEAAIALEGEALSQLEQEYYGQVAKEYEGRKGDKTEPVRGDKKDTGKAAVTERPEQRKARPPKKEKVEPKVVPRETPAKPKATTKAAPGATFTQPSKYTGKPIEYLLKGDTWHFKDSKGKWVPESPVRQKIVNDQYEGKTTEIDQLRAEVKKKAQKLKDTLKTPLGIAWTPEQDSKQLYDTYSDAYDLAKAVIKLGVKSAEQMAKDYGFKLNEAVRRAWDDAFNNKPKLKPEQHAIQEPSPKEVSPRKTPTDRKKVGEKRKQQEPPRKEVKQPKKKAVSPITRQYGFQQTLAKETSDLSKESIAAFHRNKDARQDYEVYGLQDAVTRVGKEIQDKGGFEAVHSDLLLDSAVQDLADRQVARTMALYHYGNMLELATQANNQQDIAKIVNLKNQIENVLFKESTSAGQASASLMIWRALGPDGTLNFVRQNINKVNEANSKRLLNEYGESAKDLIADLKQKVEDFYQQTLESDEIISELQNQLTSKVKGQKIKIKGTELANQFRDKFKLKEGAAYASPIPPPVYNAAIEAIAQVIEAGSTVAQLLADALSTIRKESWYKELSNADKKKVRDGVTQIVNSYRQDQVNQVEQQSKQTIKNAQEKAKTKGKEKTEEAQLTEQELTDFEQALIEEVQQDYGLSLEDATDVAKRIQNKINRAIKDAPKKIFVNKEDVRKKELLTSIVKTKGDAILETGAYNPQIFENIVGSALEVLQNLTPAQEAKINALAKTIKETSGIIQNRAIMDLAYEVNRAVNPKFWTGANLWNIYSGLQYASMLSGVTTQALNILSTGSNLIFQPIADLMSPSTYLKKGVRVRDQFMAQLASLRLMAQTMFSGKGLWVAKDIILRGQANNKYIDGVRKKPGLEFDAMERLSRDENVPWFGKDLKGNYFIRFGKGARSFLSAVAQRLSRGAKYVGRLLNAGDEFLKMPALYREQYLLSHYHHAQNLRGKALRDAVNADIKEMAVKSDDMTALEERLAKEVKQYEKSTGRKMGTSEIQRRKNEMINEAIRLDDKSKREAQQLASDYTFTRERNGAIASIATGMGRVLMGWGVGGKFVKLIYVPFTNIVGNVGEMMMDTVPLYGFARAQGYGFSGMVQRAKNPKNFFRKLDPTLEKSSMLGEKGTRARDTQMARAYFGTLGVLATMALFMGDDEDRWFQLTGGQKEAEDFGEGLQGHRPRYSIGVGPKSKRIWINYLNLPLVSAPLGLVGNINDRMRNKGDMSSDNFTDRMAASMRVFSGGLWWDGARDAGSIMMDMTFLSGIQLLTEDVEETFKSVQEGGGKTNRSVENKPFSAFARNVARNLAGAPARILPHRINLVRQIEKFWDPTVYSRKEISSTLKYEWGVHWFSDTNKKRDIFGEVVKRYPGNQFMNIDHYLGLAKTDSRYEFLDKHNAMPSQLRNSPMVINDVYRYLTEKEFEEYVKLTGKNFDKELRGYMKSGYVSKDKAYEEVSRGITKTGVQKEIEVLWRLAKEDARYELEDQLR